MGNLIKKYVHAPVVTTVHSDYRLDYLGRPVARLSYGTTNMLALRRVNYYIGVSDPMTDILICLLYTSSTEFGRLECNFCRTQCFGGQAPEIGRQRAASGDFVDSPAHRRALYSGNALLCFGD